MKDEKKYKSEPFFMNGNNGIGILLFHGWSSPPDEFLSLAKYLNSFGYTVSAPLLAGHGTKPEDLLGVTWQEWMQDSQKYLGDLKKQTPRIFVGGISMGGNLAMLLAEDENVAGVITMGASVKFHFQVLVKIGLFFMGLTKTYRKKYYPPWVRKKMGKHDVYPYYPVKSAKEVVKLAEYTQNNLSKIRKPILIMQSTTDHLVSHKSPKMIYDGVNSEVKNIFWAEKAYHVFINGEGKEKAFEKIREFISRIIS
ncbi:MAG: alpha/beta fold hydrolase [Candidatus Moranbacteria bacterium]|nr:alpha/beta fold hydrolase [Candidatus Moranbacteria bacterium]